MKMWLSEVRNVQDSWREVERLQREIKRLFAGEYVPFEPGYPAINVWSNGDNVIVTSEIPGVDPAEIEISVEGESLTVSGSRTPEELKEGETYHRQEIAYGHFRRNVRLPFRVDSSKVEARHENGVLTIALPRIEEDKPKKIEIKVE
jgi:HSP20 family protein